MTIEQQLKTMILEQYKSVRAFTITTNIPYSTIDNMLKRGISGTGIQTVLKVCHALNIDVESIESGIIKKSPAPAKAETRELEQDEHELLDNYRKLNKSGKEAARNSILGFTCIPNYKKIKDKNNAEISEIISGANSDALVDDMANVLNKAAEVSTRNQISRLLKK